MKEETNGPRPMVYDFYLLVKAGSGSARRIGVEDIEGAKPREKL